MVHIPLEQLGKVGTTAETKDYTVELINFRDDVRYSLNSGETAKTISLGDTSTTYKTLIELGDDSTEYKTLVVKYHKNLIIDKGITVTATRNRKLYIQKRNVFMCNGRTRKPWNNNNDSKRYI